MNTSDWRLISAATELALSAHKDQVRKYTASPTPYIIHPFRVACRVRECQSATSVWICAALLHGVLEDTDVPAQLIETLCGEDVLNLVLQLTNPSKQHPTLSRVRRKEIDREHIKRGSFPAQFIKYADRIDNLRDMVDAPEDFKRLYLSESNALYNALGIVEGSIGPEFQEVIREMQAALPEKPVQP